MHVIPQSYKLLAEKSRHNLCFVARLCLCFVKTRCFTSEERCFLSVPTGRLKWSGHTVRIPEKIYWNSIWDTYRYLKCYETL